ncbi:Methylenetetrahydrofolate--tRNA-(uracil-5-)-methyltransferase trmFO [Desulfurobacterium thermolithotrophum DSM 11699]|uniref:Methylenetetrahydrofolate--tRNA-(uracil-5-)-methyltransferase TrmFO n=1 Tax=Desulfurobacterium thermolithotrophum (strain DSM 11699 / BSA) TaxID=868864 RepID=F0S0X5_DESTD|nr:FADH(2)-oxidizing methylenetetrahydrofolate--tRNA-(uracil(54)-C(5))-methyltransferase TrmFO [Desulfurobacterium thermolithotrophum]ADY72779.1 Methylenetetrahydrofolate--tRNA-(uracil-5-)-methyltransferase trmFO [Desulfurobacterium thermolithotrophum DSM 11699]
MKEIINVIGAGLAGVEAAYKVANKGHKVRLFEMRPKKTTPAHKTSLFAELVCSNTLGGKEVTTPRGLLKAEMELLNSLIVEAARKTEVPAGGALAVDREKFAEYITEKIENHPNIEVVREEVTEIPKEGITIVASGPLTSDKFSEYLRNYLGEKELHFYDAISPIVYADTIDYSKCFWGSRYGKGGDDYLNCPMTEEEYERFYTALMEAEKVPLKDFEKACYFEGCMPIEEMAERGKQTLLFGPLKPVGLIDPKTGKRPFAVVQLRKENKEGTLLNLVGFQTKLKYPEQKRVFRLIPGLENAEFARFGSIHRNTFIKSPKLLLKTLQLKKNPKVFFAGQITGVEGYPESAATGIIAGINAVKLAEGKELVYPPETTMIGALLKYITTADPKTFQPMNANFGILLPPEKKIRGKRERRKYLAERALEDMKKWLELVY